MSDKTIPASQELIALILAATLYGLYLSTFLHCIRWLLFAEQGWKFRGVNKIKWLTLAGTSLIFAFSFVAVFLAALENVNEVRELERISGLSVSARAGDGDGDDARPTVSGIILCTAANLSDLIADWILVYRCWIVYDKSRRVVIFPIILWLGGIACTILQAYVQITEYKSIVTAWRPVDIKLGPGPVLTPFWGSTVVLNFYCTSMIVYKIWITTKETRRLLRPDSLRFVMRVLVESGFLYLVVALGHFVVWWTPNGFAILIFSYINIPVIGIAFNLILIRTSQYAAEENEGNQEGKAQSALVFARSSARETGTKVVSVRLGERDHAAVVEVVEV